MEKKVNHELHLRAKFMDPICVVF